MCSSGLTVGRVGLVDVDVEPGCSLDESLRQRENGKMVGLQVLVGERTVAMLLKFLRGI